MPPIQLESTDATPYHLSFLTHVALTECNIAHLDFIVSQRPFALEVRLAISPGSLPAPVCRSDRLAPSRSWSISWLSYYHGPGLSGGVRRIWEILVKTIRPLVHLQGVLVVSIHALTTSLL